MITNERQYRLTKAQAEKFRLAIEAFDAKSALASGIDPLIVRAQLNALKSQYEELLEQLAEYEGIESAQAKQLTAETIEQLPELLIKARIAQKLSQKDLAQRLGMKEQQIQRYEAERFQTASLHRLTEIAKALQLRCKIVAEVEDVAKLEDVPSNIDRLSSETLDEITIKEISQRNWLSDLSDFNQPADCNYAVRRFFERAFQGEMGRALHRKSLRSSGKSNIGALLAWQARVLLRARELRDKLHSSLVWEDSTWVKSLIRLSTETRGPLLAKEFLWRKGVILIIEPHLSRTYLDGAAMLLDNEVPVIGLALRHDRLDNFWFVLLHEIGHLLLHRRRGLEIGFFDEKVEENAHIDEKEREADRFAQTALIPDEAWKTSMAKFVKTEEEVKSLARRFGVGVSVVAGRMRRERSDYQLFSNLVGQGDVRKLFVETAII